MITAMAPILEAVLAVLGGLAFVSLVMAIVVLGARAVHRRLANEDDSSST